MPLAQQVSPMDQHKRAHLAPGDKGGSGDSLAESGGGAKDTDLVLEHLQHRSLLIFAQGAGEPG